MSAHSDPQHTEARFLTVEGNAFDQAAEAFGLHAYLLS
jgi:hypothetical protein